MGPWESYFLSCFNGVSNRIQIARLVNITPISLIYGRYGGFLKWGISKSPQVSTILKRLMTWINLGYPYFRKPPCEYQLIIHFIDDDRWMVIPFGNLTIRFVKRDSCYFPNGNYTIREIDLEQFSVFFQFRKSKYLSSVQNPGWLMII